MGNSPLQSLARDKCHSNNVDWSVLLSQNLGLQNLSRELTVGVLVLSYEDLVDCATGFSNSGTASCSKVS